MAHQVRVVSVLVSEVFGPTIQGEGPSIGRPAAFLRVAACNLSCTWCDTAYTWDWQRFDKAEEVHKLEPATVAELVMASLPYPRLLVISGGEPMLQQDALANVVYCVREHDTFGDTEVEVETAGTIPPITRFAQLVHRFNVSLKLQHSGNLIERRRRPGAIEALRDTGRATFKFVVGRERDLEEVDELVDLYDLRDVVIMPLGTDSIELRTRMAALVDPVIERGYRLTPRLHVDLWGNTRAH